MLTSFEDCSTWISKGNVLAFSRSTVVMRRVVYFSYWILMWWVSLAICFHSVLVWKPHQSQLVLERSAMVSHREMQDIRELCWSMIAISKHHSQWVSLYMFCLKISISWGMRVTPYQCAAMLHSVMYCCFPPQKACAWDILLLILFHAEKKKLMLMAWKFLVEYVFPLACINNS